MSDPHPDLEFVRLNEENQLLQQALLKAQEKLDEMEKTIKYACQDLADDDTTIRKLCRPFLTESTCDHDGYEVVPLVNAVENAINTLKQQLAQAQALCDKNFQLAATAQDEAKRLDAQLAEAKYELALSNKIRDETLQRLNECDAEIARLKSELAKAVEFIQHKPLCEWNDIESPVCTCGLTAFLARYREGGGA